MNGLVGQVFFYVSKIGVWACAETSSLEVKVLTLLMSYELGFLISTN